MVRRVADDAKCVMKSVMIRAAESWDRPEILRLNEKFQVATSPLTDDRLKDILDWSTYTRVAEVDGLLVGFIIVMGPASGYDNANLDWFRERVERFLYVDRIVVDDGVRGIGTLLYEDLFEFARLLRIPRIVCEYNVSPPNEPSRRFHKKLGFIEMGERAVNDATKKLSMQILELDNDV